MNKKSILLVVAMLVATAITCVTRDVVIHYREEQTSHVTEENSVQETEMPEIATSVSRAE